MINKLETFFFQLAGFILGCGHVATIAFMFVAGMKGMQSESYDKWTFILLLTIVLERITREMSNIFTTELNKRRLAEYFKNLAVKIKDQDDNNS